MAGRHGVRTLLLLLPSIAVIVTVTIVMLGFDDRNNRTVRAEDPPAEEPTPPTGSPSERRLTGLSRAQSL